MVSWCPAQSPRCTGGRWGTNGWEVHSIEAAQSELLVFWWKAQNSAFLWRRHRIISIMILLTIEDFLKKSFQLLIYCCHMSLWLAQHSVSELWDQWCWPGPLVSLFIISFSFVHAQVKDTKPFDGIFDSQNHLIPYYFPCSSSHWAASYPLSLYVRDSVTNWNLKLSFCPEGFCQSACYWSSVPVSELETFL